MIPNIYKGEAGYLELLQDILDQGIVTPDRTDVGECKKLFNQTLWFDLRESFPCSTVRPMSLRYGFEEMMMFLRGETDTKTLEEKGINFWKGHTSREFLDSRGLYTVPEGDLGKSYSYQYRGLGEGYVDQIANVIEQLQTNPYGRRHVVDIWAPNDHSGMPLTPCWKSWQFSVERGDGKDALHLTCEVRSSDAPFGLPSNYQQFAFLLQAASELVNMEAGVLCCNLTDVHIYKNQQEWVEELLTRCDFAYKEEATVHILPSYNGGEGGSYKIPEKNKVTLHINKELNTLEDLLSLQWEDLELEGLKVNTESFYTTKPNMAI